MKKLIIVLAMSSALACSHKSSSSTTPSGAAGSGTSPSSGGTVDTGTVNLSVSAANSAKSFAAANAKASGAASNKGGNLKAGLGLDLAEQEVMRDAVVLNDGTGTAPATTSQSLASGPPDGFKITITNIALSTAPYTQTQVMASLNQPTSPLSTGAGPATGTTSTSSGTTASAGSTGTASLALLDSSGSTSASAGSGSTSTSTASGSSNIAVTPVTIFDSGTGVTISIQSGSIDLGSLIPSFKVPVGTYKQLQITFLRKAEIMGCVTANYAIAGTPQTGSANVTGQHTYCTVDGYSDFDGTKATNATFEGATEQYMGLDLAANYDSSAKVTDTVTFTFPLSPNLVVTKGASFDLTMLFDLNRALRYYNMNRVDQGAGPTSTSGSTVINPVDRTYFYDSIFSESFYAFAGQPGKIYGYQLVASNCPYADYTSGDPAVCSNSNQESFGTIGGWLTLITDPTGAPLAANLASDDDDALVVLRGNNNGISPFITAGSTSGMVDIGYSVGCPGYPDQLQNFNPNLDSVAVGSQVTGVTFLADPNCSQDYAPSGSTPAPYVIPNAPNENTGPVFVLRVL